MDSRRIAALELLERLRRHEVEEETRRLGELRTQLQTLTRQREALLHRLREESHADDPALIGYLGDFVRSVRGEIGRLEQGEAHLEPEISALEDRVSDAFREIKSFEILRLNEKVRRLEELRLKEEAEAGEVALSRWQSRRRAAARRIR